MRKNKGISNNWIISPGAGRTKWKASIVRAAQAAKQAA